MEGHGEDSGCSEHTAHVTEEDGRDRVRRREELKEQAQQQMQTILPKSNNVRPGHQKASALTTTLVNNWTVAKMASAME